MESQPQNPEFRINPEKFHPCDKYQNLMNWPISIWRCVIVQTHYPQYLLCVVLLVYKPTLIACGYFYKC